MTVENVTIEVEANTDKAMRSLRSLDNVTKNFGRNIANALSNAVIKGEDLDDLFRSLAQNIASNALKDGLKPLQDLLSGGLNNLLSSFSKGGRSPSSSGNGVFSAFANALPFAKGGIVASPSFFPLNSGLGVAGEAGPEAIIPLQRGSDGRLGIGGNNGGGVRGGNSIVVNISTPDIAGFRRSEAQVTSALSRAVQRSRRTL